VAFIDTHKTYRTVLQMRATMNISLPASLKTWIERQVTGKGYSTASEYVRDLLRREQEQEARARIEAKLTEAINNGASTPMLAQDWDRIRAAGLKRARSRRRK
jgi:antitoxin ParD1/3/4